MTSLYKKIPYLKFIPVILITIVLYKIIDNASVFLDGILFVISIFSYVMWGVSIAYLLNPAMVYIEKKLKTPRVLSISIIYVAFAGVIVFASIILIPALSNNVAQLAKSLPFYVDKTRDFAQEKMMYLKANDTHGLYAYVQQNMNLLLQKAGQDLDVFANFILMKTIGFTSGIAKFVVGILISIYLLKDKEELIAATRRLVRAVFGKRTSSIMLDIGEKTNEAFSKYITAKIIDSIIIGIICFIGLLALKTPYALLFSIIVGFTNLIPYIGPIIGSTPAILVMFIVSPIHAFGVLIFLVVLQLFDGWVLTPKIVGDKIGLRPIAIIASIMAGGALYGALGMFVAIPIAAVIKHYMHHYIEFRLQPRGHHKEIGEEPI